MTHRFTIRSTIHRPKHSRTILGVMLALLLPIGAQAAFIQVADFVDDADVANGTCTLREAIRSANTNLPVDACTSGSSTQRDYILVSPGTHFVDLASGNDEDAAVTGDLDILEEVTIRGASAEYSIIDGTGAAAADRLFHVHGGANGVRFERVALRGGVADGRSKVGGVILNAGGNSEPLQLIQSEVSGGQALGGGGIFNSGGLNVDHSRIFGNRARLDAANPTGAHGGGIASTDGGAELHIFDSEISGNDAEEDGGGIWVERGVFTLRRSRVVENTADGLGGGLYLSTPTGDDAIEYVEFRGNSALGGGGALFDEANTVRRSLFVDNEALLAGGGLADTFGGFVRYSTFTRNEAPLGAGLYADTMGTVLDSNTIAGNLGDGVYNDSGVTFEQGIIANNPGGNCTGVPPGFGAFNMEDTNSCGFVSSVDQPNHPNTDPLLGPLQDNGGPTPTMALLPGSPAIDAVTSEIRMNCEMDFDQRGHPRGRPRTMNSGGSDVFLCDVGAFERTRPYVVDSLADAADADLADDLCLTAGGVCSLRAAIQQANAISGLDEIELGVGIHQLSIAGRDENNADTGDLDLDTPVTIRGAGAGLTTIDGGGLDRVLDVGTPDHIATNAPALTLLADLAITGGDAGSDNGGGITTRRDLRVERVVLSGNVARRGSAISSSRTGGFSSGEIFPVEVVDSTVTANSGALPLYLHDARVQGSSLVDNIATISTNGGAGEFIRLQLSNSTVSGNYADSTGAFFAGQAIVESSTIYDNSADFAPGGMFLLDLSVFRNSIVAGNVAGGILDNCALNSGAAFSFGFNLTDTGITDCSLADVTDQIETDPVLDGLADNGGETPTHLPLAGSPLIDRGDDEVCPALDQRGLWRPLDGDENGSVVCDVGAVEVPEPALTVGLLAGGLALGRLGRRRRAGVLGFLA